MTKEGLGKKVPVEEFKSDICPECWSSDVCELDENFDENYLTTSLYRHCGTWWTALYKLDSVFSHEPPCPLLEYIQEE